MVAKVVAAREVASVVVTASMAATGAVVMAAVRGATKAVEARLGVLAVAVMVEGRWVAVAMMEVGALAGREAAASKVEMMVAGGRVEETAGAAVARTRH